MLVINYIFFVYSIMCLIDFGCACMTDSDGKVADVIHFWAFFFVQTFVLCWFAYLNKHFCVSWQNFCLFPHSSNRITIKPYRWLPAEFKSIDYIHFFFVTMFFFAWIYPCSFMFVRFRNQKHAYFALNHWPKV